MRPLPTFEDFQTTSNTLQFMMDFIAFHPNETLGVEVHDAMRIAWNNLPHDDVDYADIGAKCEPPKRVTRACDIQGHSDLFRGCAGAIIRDEA